MFDVSESEHTARSDHVHPAHAHRDIIVIGASAGGVEAISQIIGSLPEDIAAAIFVVIHIAPTARSLLPAILARRGLLPAKHPRDGEPIEKGVIYVAPPDHHLMLERGRMRVVRGPSENGTRPAVDPLFRSAATAYGARVIGVVLSGNLDDGTAGLIAVSERGGVAIVQDPEDALFPGMPTSAAEHVPEAVVLPLTAIPAAILAATAERVDAVPPRSPTAMRTEVQVAEFETNGGGGAALPLPPGDPSGFTCPHCHGALWEIDEGRFIRYRCRVGHAFSPETLVALDSDALEEAIWVAYRSLEESAALARRMEARAVRNEHTYSADRFGQHAEELEARAAILRTLLVSGPTLTAAEPESMLGPE